MKFLITSRAKPGAQRPLDYKKVAQEAADAINQALTDGVFDCVYQRIGGGGVAIANFDSAEDLFAALVTYPLYSLFDWQVEPLVDAHFSFQLSIGDV